MSEQSKAERVSSHAGFDLISKFLIWMMAVIVFPLAIYAYSQDQKHQDTKIDDNKSEIRVVKDRTETIDVLTKQVETMDGKIDDIAEDVRWLVREKP